MSVKRLVTALGLALAVCGAAAQPSQAELQVTQFQLTPSTTKAGGHPSLDFSASFLGANGAIGIKDIAAHLPTGLRFKPTNAPYCTKRKLIENRCPVFAKVGTVTVGATAFGKPIAISREIYNMRPTGSQKVKFGGVALPGISAILPLTARPDGGLDINVSSLPQIGGTLTEVQLDRVQIKVKGKQRGKPLVTNPTGCVPASTVLDVGFNDPAVPRVTANTSFLPTGC